MPSPAQKFFLSPPLRPLLSAFADIGHRRVLRNSIDPIRLPVPVISVGNITFGGTSKTPMVEFLARQYSGRGLLPGIVTRGYLGEIDRKRLPPEIVSDGSRVLLDWTTSGDEARQLAESLLPHRVPVAVGRDRVTASKILIDRFNIDLIILDDGFQFTGIHRDLDLVLIDSLAPFGRYDTGLGILREPVTALSRADSIVLTHTDAVDVSRIDEIHRVLADHVSPLPRIINARTLVRRIGHCGNSQVEDIQSLSDSSVTAFAGIANPLGFERTIGNMGCKLTRLFEYPDHHSYSASNLRRVNRFAETQNADYILTTSKDAVRLNGHTSVLTIPLRIVEIELEICEGSAQILSGAIIDNKNHQPITIPTIQ